MAREYEPGLFEAVQELERELGLPDGWYRGLLRDHEESDWSFVIKLHALFEAATAHTIVAALDRPAIKEFVERLSMRGYASKIALGKSLGVLDRQFERFVDILSAVRNDCIHDVRNVTFAFKGYVAGMEDGDRNRFLSVFDGLIRDPVPTESGKPMARRTFIQRYTRFSLWTAGIRLLANIYIEKQRARVLARGIEQMTIGDWFKGMRSGDGLLMQGDRKPAKK